MNYTEKRKYGLFDYVRFGFSFQPFYATYLLLHGIIQALLPTLNIFVTAGFVDVAIDVLQGSKPKSALIINLLTLLGIKLYDYASGYLKEAVNIRYRQSTERKIRTAVVKKRACLDYRYIESNDTWDLMKRVCDDPTTKFIVNFYAMLDYITFPIGLVSLLLTLLSQVWWTVPYLLVCAVPFIIVSIRGGKQFYEKRKEVQKLWRRFGYYDGVLTSKDTVEERGLFSTTAGLLPTAKKLYEKAMKLNMKLSLLYRVRRDINGIGSSVVVAVGTVLLCLPLRDGLLTVGMFISLQGVLNTVLNKVGSQLPSQIMDTAQHREYLRDYEAFCALDETPGAIDLPDRNGLPPFETLEFRHVSFTYPGTDKQILKDCSFVIARGRHYAIVGQNGAGKTTVVKLLLGLYQPNEGEILLNGEPLDNHPYAQRKALIGAVFQDYASYSVSFADNIRLGDLSKQDDALMKSLVTELSLDELVAKLPDGYDTELGNISTGSVNISGGEWQRLAIARCAYRQADLQILDEPTASLDPVAESRIYEIFGEISKQRTTIFITHRLGAAKLADEIIVIENGTVAEQDPHATLLAKKGIYSEMFEVQRSWYEA